MEKATIYPYNKFAEELLEFKTAIDYEIRCILDTKVKKDVSDIEIISEIDKALEGSTTLILMDKKIVLEDNEEEINEWKEVLLKANKKKMEIISLFVINDSKLLEFIKENKLQLLTYIETQEEVKELLDKRIDKGVRFTRRAELWKSSDKIKRIGCFETKANGGEFETFKKLFNDLNMSEKVTAITNRPYGFLLDMIQLHNVKLNHDSAWEYLEASVMEREEECEYLLTSGEMELNWFKRSSISEGLKEISILFGFRVDEAILSVGFDDDKEIKDWLDIFRIFYAIEEPQSFVLWGEGKTEKELLVRKEELEKRFGVKTFLGKEKLTDIKSYIISGEIEKKRGTRREKIVNRYYELN